MPVNPNARMITSPSLPMDAKKESAASLEQTQGESAGVDENDKMADPTPEKKMQSPKDEIKDEELLKDLDLEKFYLTGKMTYAFKMFDKLSVTFRLLTSEEVLETNNNFFRLSNEDRSFNAVMLEHTMNILAKSLVRYGDTALEAKSEEERLKFIHSLPGILIPKLMYKYNVFEKSVDKALSDGTTLKN